MSKLLYIGLIALFSILCADVCASAAVISYPAPDGVRMNEMYTVRVRAVGETTWQEVPVYGARATMNAAWSSISQDVGIAYFDMDAPAEVEISCRQETEFAYQIRPDREIESQQDGNVLRFVLNEPEKLSIEIDGNRYTNLMLYANPIEDYQEKLEGRDVIYLGPGLHTDKNCIYITSNHRINVPSDTVLFIDGGAVVQAEIYFEDVKNAAVIGHGMLDFDQFNSPNGINDVSPYLRGVYISNSEQITVDGIISKNACYYTIGGKKSNQITIQNFKSISASLWADGIDCVSCSNVTISDCFIRSADDSLAIYNSRGSLTGNSTDWEISDTTFWSDVAHPIHIGLHGSQKETIHEVIEDISFQNIDILEANCSDRTYWGAIAINCGDSNIVRNINFNTIRIYDFTQSELIRITNGQMGTWNPIPGYLVENIQFKNIYYNGDTENRSTIEGDSANSMVKNIGFENVVINGEQKLDFESWIDVGQFTEDIYLLDDGTRIDAPPVVVEETETFLGEPAAYTLYKPQKALRLDANLDDWEGIPMLHFPEDSSQNVISAYTGDADLSFDVGMTYDAEYLYFCFDITDDYHVLTDPSLYWEGDNIQIAAGGENGYGPEYGIDDGGVYGNAQFSSQAPLGAESIQVASKQGENGNMVYEIAIPWLALFKKVPESDFKLCILLNENDGTGRRGYIEWTPGIASGKSDAQFKILEFDVLSDYKDVIGHWAEKYIKACVKQGILSGNGAGMMAPDQMLTRAEFISMICRAAEFEMIRYDGCFMDVQKYDWYADAARTAYGFGLLPDLESNCFDGEELLTREEAAYILAKTYAQRKQLEIPENISDFSDAGAIANWARDAVALVQKLGFMVGDAEYFYPKNHLTKAEAGIVMLKLREALHG